ELFAFLQGSVPEGCHLQPDKVPKLTDAQAWTVIWYLGELHWQVTDYIERCNVCGGLFDSNVEGACLDYGEAPYHFCEACTCSIEYETKQATEDAAE
ncbi:hypothetical protein LCGC14_1857240, partial [marine sediment metagenome]